MLKRNLYLLLALVFLNLSPFLVYGGIGVQPTVTELNLSPGKRKAGTFTVLNDGDKAVKVKVELEDWGEERKKLELIPGLRLNRLNLNSLQERQEK